MKIQEYARKYTDAEYLTKKQITEIVGVSISETVWVLTTQYRDKYRYPLTLKRFDKLPFSIVVPPSVIALANTTEIKMLNYAKLFDRYQVREEISDEKTLSYFKQDRIKEDILALAHKLEMVVSDKDIALMLEPDKFHLHNTVLWGYNKTINYLIESKSLGFSKSLIRDMYNCINNSENTTLFYRSEGQLGEQRQPINEYEGASGTTAKINEHMNMLLDYYAADYEMSPFIISAVIFTYFLYISPFEKHNLCIAILLMLKVIADAGYGESVYYTGILDSILKKEDELKDIFDEVKRSGDVTYAITFMCETFIDSIDWQARCLGKLPLPKPYLDPVRTIESVKEVEKIVYRDREVEVEKIVEVPVIQEVEKIVYRDRYIEVPRMEEKKEEVKEEVKPLYDDYKEEEYVEYDDNSFENNFEEESKHEFNQYEYNDNDPFARIPVSHLNLEEPVKKTSTYDVVEEIEEVEEETNVVKEEEIPEVNTFVEDPTPVVEVVKKEAVKTHQDVEKITSLKALEGLENDAFAKALVELNPTIKYNQALFYVRHRTVGRYYTIGQFKDFLDCAYETARTSMEFMTAIGLYRKEQLKNKFVYTPVDFSVENDI